MLDIQFIRENPEKVKKACRSKGYNSRVVDEVLRLNEERKKLIQKVDKLRALRNKLTKDDREKGREIKKKLRDIEPQLKRTAADYKELLLRIPNIPAGDVPLGKNESDNVIIKKWGKPRKFDFPAKDHLEIGEALDIIDVKKAAKVCGSRFAYLKNDAVLLEFALVQFALQKLISQGFIPLIPPVLLKKKMMQAMGYLEHGGESDMFVLEKDGLVLVGTSEQSIGPMHTDEIFEKKDLPKRYAGFSSCFRREAGSYGKDTRGILRVHQFDKIEMFSFTTADKGDEEHNYFLSLEEKFFQALEIPYRVMKMCTGDLGVPAARKYDLEAWMPGQGKYREVTSTSTCTDFQARRLNIKYREKGKLDYVHMLNGTAFAIGRTIIAILENYQQKDGSVIIPKILQAYIGKEKIIPR